MKKTRMNNKIVILLVSGMILCAVAVGVVVAYIIAYSDSLRNEFVPAHVMCKIEETFADNVKKDVHIKNTGDVDAYIRATVIANWVSDDKAGKIHSSSPKEGVDYSVEWGTEGWKKFIDGFWYYENAVAPEDVTKNLIETSATITEAPEGYHLEIQILATAIQSTPVEVVEQEWGVTVEEGVLTVKKEQ